MVTNKNYWQTINAMAKIVQVVAEDLKQQLRGEKQRSRVAEEQFRVMESERDHWRKRFEAGAEKLGRSNQLEDLYRVEKNMRVAAEAENRRLREENRGLRDRG